MSCHYEASIGDYNSYNGFSRNVCQNCMNKLSWERHTRDLSLVGSWFPLHFFCPKNSALKRKLGPNSMSGPKNFESQKLIGQKSLCPKQVSLKKFTPKVF